MRLGLITDIHEDVERLIIAIRGLEKENCDKIACLGDICGFDERFYSYKYGRNFNYCVDILRENCEYIIPGNHDLNQMKVLPQYNSVFHFPDNWYQLSYEKRNELSKGRVWLYENDSQINQLDRFGELFTENKNRVVLDIDGITISLSHSVSPDISGFLTRKPTKPKDFSEHLATLKESSVQDSRIGISGHLHPNGLLVVNEKKVKIARYSEYEIGAKETIHFVIPCIADGIQDNGFTVLDTKNRIIQLFHLRTPRHKLGVL